MPDDTTGTEDTGTATIPNLPADTAAGDAPAAFETILNDDFKDKTWAKELTDSQKTVPDFLKMFDDQKAALSRRPAGIPQDNAPQDEKDAFHLSMGVPVDPKEYDFAIEGREFTEADTAFHDALRPLFKKANITPEQLAVLGPGFEEVTKTLVGQKGEADQKQDVDFDTRATEVFGDRKEEVMKQGKALIALADERVRGDVDNMSNDELIRLASILDGVRQKYISEDALPTNPTQTTMTNQEKIIEGTKLMATDAYRNEFPALEHNAMVERVNRLFGTHVD